jgi:translocation and assembly module TamB
MDIKLGETDIDVSAKSSKISALMKMRPFDGKVTGNVRLAGMTTTLEGEARGNIVIHSDVDSFRTLMQTVRSFYAVEGLPKMDGKLNLSLIVSEGKEVYLNILSPEVIYYENRTTTHVLSDVSVILKKSGGNVELSSYHLIYNDMTFYSSKPSEVHFKDQTITIPQLWLNNQLKITGELNTKTFKGQIDANASTFRFAHEWVELDAGVDIQTVFDGNRTDITGKVTVFDGKILYDLDTKSFPSDSDIVIVQDMKKDQNSTFMDQLTMMIKVDTQKPIVYKQGAVNVEATVDLGIHKAPYLDPMIIGSIDIVDGSSYNFQGKVFKLEHSQIYLTGDPAKPMLDLTVKYKALKHMITIVVTGTPTRPNIIFSSVPSLSREQILSLILFDSEEAADTNDANDMMKMMGGAMAKSALNDWVSR